MQIELEKLEKKHKEELEDVLLRYAKEATKYKIGSIIQDHSYIGSVVKVRINTSNYSKTFTISYVCKRLKRNLTLYKSGELGTIYQSNVIKQFK